MVSLKRLSIQGIRAYDPEICSDVEFENTLNLFHGKNGSGKTTILECLRLMLTGSFPPGTRMANFVNDLKVSATHEITGKIVLDFIETNGRTCRAVRGMIVQNKNNKIESKTIESCIEVEEQTGRKRTITSRTGDTSKEINSLINTNISIIENVVLCHHDDSCWPLGEAKMVKERFDEIFATTNYNKALELIKTLRKTKYQESIETQTLVEYQNKIVEKTKDLQDKLNCLISNIEQKNIQVKNSKSILNEYEKQINKIKNDVKQLEHVNKKINELQVINRQLTADSKTLSSGFTEFDPTAFSDVERSLADAALDGERFKGMLENIDKNIERSLNDVDADNLKLNQKVIEHSINEKQLNDVTAVLDGALNNLKAPHTMPDVNFLEKYEHLLLCYNQAKKETDELIDKEMEKLDRLKMSVDSLTLEQRNAQVHIGQLENSYKLNKETEVNLQNQVMDITTKINKIESLAAKVSEKESSLKLKQVHLRTLESNPSDQSTFNEMETQARSIRDELSQLEEQIIVARDKLAASKEYETYRLQADEIKRDIADIYLRNKKVISETTIVDEIPDNSQTSSINTSLSQRLAEIELEIHQLNNTLSCIEYQNSQIKLQLVDKNDQLKVVQTAINEMKNIQAIGDDSKTLEERVALNLRKSVKHDTLSSFHKKTAKKIIKTASCPICDSSLDQRHSDVALKINMIAEEHANQSQKYQEIYNKYSESQKIYEKQLSEHEKFHELSSTERQICAEIESLIKTNTSNDGLLIAKRKLLEEQNELKSGINKAILDMNVAAMKHQDIEALRTKMSSIPYEISFEKLQERLDSLVNEAEQKRMKLKATQTEIDAKGSMIESMKSERNTLREQIISHQEELLILKYNINMAENLTLQRTDITNKLESANRNASLLESQISEKQSNLQQISAQLSSECTNQANLSKKIDELQLVKTKHNCMIDRVVEDCKKLIDGNIIKKLENTGLAISELRQFISASNFEIEQMRINRKSVMEELEKLKIKIDMLHTYKKIKDINDKINSNVAEMSNLFQIVSQLCEGKDLPRELEKLTNKTQEVQNKVSQMMGSLIEMERQKKDLEKELSSPPYIDSMSNYLKSLIKLKVLTKAINDLDKYYNALDYAITMYHSDKMAQINKIIKQYWSVGYCSDDIDTIEICSEIDETETKFKQRKSYNYRVVMLKNGISLDMRGRCSAGQKMIASIIIRLALFKAFRGSCSFIALDEPTTNLDEHNIKGLADSIKCITKNIGKHDHFQIILITHDEKFLRHITHEQDVSNYFHIFKNESGYSVITKKKISQLCQ